MTEPEPPEHIRPVSRFRRDTTDVPNWLLVRRDLKPIHRFIVILLLMYEQNGEEPALDELAQVLGYQNKRNIQFYLNDLQEAKVVKIKRRVGRPSLYMIYNPLEPHQKAVKRHDPAAFDHDDQMIMGAAFDHHDQMITPPKNDHGSAPRQNALKRRTHDQMIMGRPHVGGVLHSGSCFDSSKQPPTRVAETPTTGEKPLQPPLTELAKWLFRQKVSAAREFGHLDYNAAKKDFEERRRAGQSVGAIVAAWRIAPPQPETADDGVPEWIRRLQREEPHLYRAGSDDDDLAPNDDLDFSLLDELDEEGEEAA